MKKLTVGILAHVDSGKTTLSEAGSVLEHIYPNLMLSALERGRKKNVREFAGKPRTDDAFTETKNVCVVVRSCEFGAEIIGTSGGSDTFLLVGNHAHADARSADENTFVTFAVLNFFAKFFGKNGIMTRLLRIGSEVDEFNIVFFEMKFQLLFESEAGVIRCDRNHGLFSFHF